MSTATHSTALFGRTGSISIALLCLLAVGVNGESAEVQSRNECLLAGNQLRMRDAFNELYLAGPKRVHPAAWEVRAEEEKCQRAIATIRDSILQPGGVEDLSSLFMDIYKRPYGLAKPDARILPQILNWTAALVTAGRRIDPNYDIWALWGPDESIIRAFKGFVHEDVIDRMRGYPGFVKALIQFIDCDAERMSLEGNWAIRTLILLETPEGNKFLKELQATYSKDVPMSSDLEQRINIRLALARTKLSGERCRKRPAVRYSGDSFR